MKLSVIVGLVGVASANSHLGLHLHVGQRQGANDWKPAGPDDGKFPRPIVIPYRYQSCLDRQY